MVNWLSESCEDHFLGRSPCTPDTPTCKTHDGRPSGRFVAHGYGTRLTSSRSPTCSSQAQTMYVLSLTVKSPFPTAGCSQ